MKTADEYAQQLIREVRLIAGLNDPRDVLNIHGGIGGPIPVAFAQVLAIIIAEVREEKRKEVVADIKKLSEGNLTPLYQELYAFPSLQPPVPDPSERAMRVARDWFVNKELSVNDLALLIDAEFGAGK